MLSSKDVFDSMRRWPILAAWLWATLLVAGVSVANAERQEETAQRQTAKVSGSAAVSKACKNKSASDILVKDMPAEVRKRIPVFYSEIRRPVRVKLDKDFYTGTVNPRPKGFFQLAGAHNKKLCAEVLKAFNEPDPRHLDDGDNRKDMHFDFDSDWLSNNSRIVSFTELENSGAIAPWSLVINRKMFECAMLDIDGDDREEYLYRYTTWLGGRITQDVMIMDHTANAPHCRSDLPWEAVSKYHHNMMMLPHERSLPEEWFVTKSFPIESVVSDKRSREMITSPKDCNEIIRNVEGHNSVFWNFHRMPSGVVMVSVPDRNLAPPELLVFTPARDAVRLQCILMPVIWRKFPPKNPRDDYQG
jgi:hypothetical protein